MKITTHPDGILRALTIDEPYASLIVGGIKTAENRGWKWHRTFPLPMTLAIHASCRDDGMDEFDEICQDDEDIYDAFDHPNYQPCTPGLDYFYGGCIVGLVDVIGCVEVGDRDEDDVFSDMCDLYGNDEDATKAWDWTNGPYAFLLRNARRFKTPIVCPGSQMIWRLPPSIQKQCFDHSKDLIELPSMPTLPVNGRAKILGVKDIAR
jgi:ASCH domain